jgi:hypothetical protein
MNNVGVDTRKGPSLERAMMPLDPSLIEKAGNLGRAAVMKDVLGPHLDTMLRPLYEAEITQEEVLPSLEGDFPLRVLTRFFIDLRYILQNRFHASVRSGEEYEEFLDLNANRNELIFYSADPMRSIKEALGTSIGVPLKVASWISGLEKPKESICYPEPVGYPLLDVGGLTEIMKRESFKNILSRLTKGPNEFLGEGSDEFTEDGIRYFYAFKLGERRLKAADIFDIQDNLVIGLNDTYALAAEQRRQVLRSGSPSRHKGNESSGCPVRHSFEDASGRPQEPLILTATMFLEGALKHAEQIPFKLGTSQEN